MAVMFQWEDKYSVHHPTIDEEHQRLFEIANQIVNITDPLKEAERFRTLVKSLFRYMEVHFQHEEQLMAEANYGDRAGHHVQHREIVTEMNRAVSGCKSLVKLAHWLRHFMLDWVLKHVIEEDVRMAAAVNARAAPAEETVAAAV